MPIAAEEAVRHRLYGVTNWLAVFAFTMLFGLLRELGSVSGEAHKAGMTITQLLSVDHPAASFAKLALGLNFVLVALIYWALLTKQPKFRVIASSALLSSWPLAAAIGAMYPFDGIGEALGASFFSWVLYCAIWVTYLQRSRRVRVTFEHCIRAEEVATARHPDLVSKPPTAMPAAAIKLQEGQESKSREASPIAAKPIKPEGPQLNSSAANDDEALWEIAIAEFEGSGRRAGLYAKVFSENNGDESLTKAAYLRKRVDQLAAERVEQERAENEARDRSASEAKSEIEDLKAKFIVGKQLTPEEVQKLAQNSHLDSTLPGLWERHRGETLLHWCARFGLKHEIEILLKNGANPKASNANGKKPSAVTDDLEIRRLLLSAAGEGEA
jgi:hypothetical protein